MKNRPKAKYRPNAAFWGKILKYGIPLVVSVGLCWVLFHDLSFSDMIDFVRRDCSWGYILVSMAIGFVAYIFRAMRWRIQLRAARVQTPLHPVVYSIIGTYAVNLVLPRFGELWRCTYISRRQSAPFATVFGSMVAERVADTVTVLLILLVTFLVASGPITGFFNEYPQTMESLRALLTSPYTYLTLAAIAVGVWALLRLSRGATWRTRLRQAGRKFTSGFASIFHMKGAGWWVLLTLLLWGSYLLQMWFCFKAFGMTENLLSTHGFVIVLVTFAIASLSMAVPSNGGIGPYQAAVIFALLCFAPDIDMAAATSFANVVLGAQTLLNILCGLGVFGLIALENRLRTPSRPVSTPEKA